MLRQRKRPRQEIERGFQQCSIITGKRETRCSMDNNKGNNKNRKRIVEGKLEEKTRKAKTDSTMDPTGNGVMAELGTRTRFHLGHCKV
jgi:hypothetical protein